MIALSNALSRAMNYVQTIRISDVVDILIVAFLIFKLIQLIRKTNTYNVAKGLLIFLVVLWLAELLRLTMISFILRKATELGVVVLVILFQPEFRKALERMGRSRLITKKSKKQGLDDDRELLVAEIMQTLTDLSKRRVGALIVFEQQTGLEDVIETGTRLNASISAPLLENVFEPNTPLHDGAVVIRDDVVEAAACILPLAEASGVSRELGTRHRAAVGISENTDAIVLIVSEETGIISMARDGVLTRPMSVSDLNEILNQIYSNRRTWFTALREILHSRTEESVE